MKKVSYYILILLILSIIGAALFIFQVICLEKGGGDNLNADNTILNNVLFKETKVVKSHRVFQLTSNLWYLSGGDYTKLMLEDI